MKIERISDSQIRCTLSNFDLSERNLKMSELAYGNEKARRLFHEMIQKASAEVGFEAEDFPLMVEAIPLPNESVVLLITKVDDPEEMDTRFSRFSPPPENGFADSGLEALKAISEESHPAQSDAPQPDAPERLRTFVFDSLDQMIEAAKAVRGNVSGTQTLYKNPSNSRYYLVVKEGASHTEAFSVLCNQLMEYGAMAPHNRSGESYFREHYELILKENVLSSLGKIS